MKSEWSQRFVAILLQHRGERTEVDYAKFLGLARSTYQRIVRGNYTISYPHVQTALENLGICHCEVAGLVCTHDKPGARR